MTSQRESLQLKETNSSSYEHFQKVFLEFRRFGACSEHLHHLFSKFGTWNSSELIYCYIFLLTFPNLLRIGSLQVNVSGGPVRKPRRWNFQVRLRCGVRRCVLWGGADRGESPMAEASFRWSDGFERARSGEMSRRESE